MIVVDNRATDHSADLCSPVSDRDAARREQAGLLKALAFASDQKLVAKIRRLIDVATALQAQERCLFALLHIDLEAAVRTERTCPKSPLFSLTACAFHSDAPSYAFEGKVALRPARAAPCGECQLKALCSDRLRPRGRDSEG